MSKTSVPMPSRDAASTDVPEPPAALSVPHAEAADKVLAAIGGSLHGLSKTEVATRFQRYGRNTLPRARPPGIGRVFMHQFASPLIYVLVAAALLSLVIQEWSDAGFIAAVLFINAIIGTTQEYSAQRAADALNALVTGYCARAMPTRSTPKNWCPATSCYWSRATGFPPMCACSAVTIWRRMNPCSPASLPRY